MTPYEAATALDAVVREQLLAAWQRGVDSAPHGMSALADRGAGDSFRLIQSAADAYGKAIADNWREKLDKAEKPPASKPCTP